jgi:KDO2-lipid IV(A) lauroyltransferase
VERLAAAFLLFAIRSSARLSLTGQRRAGRVLGWLLRTLRTDAARVTRINLERCFPELSDAAREALVRASLLHTALLFAEAGILFHWPAKRWRDLVVCVEGEALLTKAQDDGRGVLLLVPHLGNWEFLSLYLGGIGITALYDPPRLPALDTALRRARSRTGATLVPLGYQGARAIYRALTANAVAVLLPDQVPAREAGTYAAFFGHPALTMTFAHRLIVRTNPVVLFAVALRVAGGFAIRFVPAEAEMRAADVDAAATSMNRSIERLVREAPEQYQWEYKRFKRPPEGRRDWYRG